MERPISIRTQTSLGPRAKSAALFTSDASRASRAPRGSRAKSWLARRGPMPGTRLKAPREACSTASALPKAAKSFWTNLGVGLGSNWRVGWGWLGRLGCWVLVWGWLKVGVLSFGVGVVERCGKHGFAKRSWNRLMEPSLAHLGRGSVLLNPAICSRDEHVEPPPA